MEGNGTTLPETRLAFAAGRVDSDAWAVAHVEAREAMSELYRARVVLVMESGGGGLHELLGAPARLAVQRGGLVRELRGVVSEVEELGTTVQHRLVRVEVVPALWTLSQRSDCRIFQALNTAQIVRAVLADAGVYQGDGALRIDPSVEAMAPREYCVQYMESDLDFVRRLLEDDGVPFYFVHAGDGGEALVLAGDEHGWAEVATLDGGPVGILDAGMGTGSAETVQWFDEKHALKTSAVTVRDYDFSRPRATMDMTGRHSLGAGRLARYEYPARSTLTGYDDGARAYKTHNTARLAKLRAEEHQTRAHRGHGRSVVTGMTPGQSFALHGHERPELDRRYLVTAVEHRASDWTAVRDEVRQSARFREMLDDAGVTAPDGTQARYGNRVETHRLDDNPASVAFRPARVTPRPVVEGPQTARVVGPAGEDIHTDPHGRVKVQFHWDRLGREDDTSSCWIRVAQSMGGGSWGFAFIPRIGMEVVVSFLEGDPDRPMVTGCVYNGENPHATPMPETKTKTGLRTQSTPKTGGYNEMRFEDAAGKEQVYVQAERDMDTLVKHDETLTVQRHRTKLVQGDEFNTVEMNRVSKVVQNDTLTVDGNREAEVHGPTGDTLTVDNDQEVKVGGSQSITVSGSQSTTVSKSQSTTVMMASQETVTLMKAVQVGLAFQITVGARFEVICGMSRLTMDALGNISLSGEQIDITSNGPVAVNGTIIDLN